MAVEQLSRAVVEDTASWLGIKEVGVEKQFVQKNLGQSMTPRVERTVEGGIGD